jgi:hypothetical protein
MPVLSLDATNEEAQTVGHLKSVPIMGLRQPPLK